MRPIVWISRTIVPKVRTIVSIFRHMICNSHEFVDKSRIVMSTLSKFLGLAIERYVLLLEKSA